MENNKLIILDIDGTLIDAHFVREDGHCDCKIILDLPKPIVIDVFGKEYHIFKRPGLEEFLDYCKDNFEHVALWTNGMKEWLDIFIEKVLKNKYNFLFAYWLDHQKLPKPEDLKKPEFKSIFDNMMVKDLRRVYSEFSSLGVSKHNTLIIEDDDRNCKRNENNCIIVSRYDVIHKVDEDLDYLVKFLEHFVIKESKPVHEIAKEDWDDQVYCMGELIK